MRSRSNMSERKSAISGQNPYGVTALTVQSEYKMGIDGYSIGKPANHDSKDINVLNWKHGK